MGQNQAKHRSKATRESIAGARQAAYQQTAANVAVVQQQVLAASRITTSGDAVQIAKQQQMANQMLVATQIATKQLNRSEGDTSLTKDDMVTIAILLASIASGQSQFENSGNYAALTRADLVTRIRTFIFDPTFIAKLNDLLVSNETDVMTNETAVETFKPQTNYIVQNQNQVIIPKQNQAIVQKQNQAIIPKQNQAIVQKQNQTQKSRPIDDKAFMAVFAPTVR